MKKNFLAVTAVVSALSGCASQAVKDASKNLDQSDLAYGAVMQTKPLDSSVMSSHCAKQSSKEWVTVCRDLANYEQAKLAFLNSGRMVTAWVIIPSAWRATEHSIVKVYPNRAAIGVELVAASPTPLCRWTGTGLDLINGKSGVAAGFAAGLLIVPAVAVALDDSMTEGGVECNGWSYKQLLRPGIATR